MAELEVLFTIVAGVVVVGPALLLLLIVVHPSDKSVSRIWFPVLVSVGDCCSCMLASFDFFLRDFFFALAASLERFVGFPLLMI